MVTNKHFKQFFPLMFTTGTIVGYLLYSLSTLTYRHGDGNLYLYAGHALTQGILPYSDYVFADPPVLPIILALFGFIARRAVESYLVLPILLETINALLLYGLLKRWKTKYFWLAPLVYLFSLPILRTSNHFQGSQLTVFFALSGIFLWDTNKPLLSGISWALGFLTKLYVIPAYFGFLLAVYLSKRKKLIKKLLIGSIATAIFVLLLFLCLAPNNFFQDVVLFPLFRHAEFSKLTTLGNYTHDTWPLLIIALISIISLEQSVIIFPLIALAIFFLLFKDIFYIYLVNMHWYLIALCILFVGKIKKNWIQRGLVGVFLIYIGWSTYQYQVKFFDQSRFDNAPAVAEYLEKQPDKFSVYGFHEMVPLVAFLSGRMIYKNILDTHPQLFSNGILNRDTISQSAVNDGVYLIYLEQLFPDGSRFRSLDGTFFSRKIFNESCKHQKDIPVSQLRNDVVVGIYRCAQKNRSTVPQP